MAAAEAEEGDSIDEFLDELEAEAENYDTFGTVEELYRAAENPSNADEILHEGFIPPEESDDGNIYITPEMAEDLDESFDQIDEALEEDTNSGIWDRIKGYTESVRNYASKFTPNDKWDWTAYGSGLALGTVGFLTGSIGLQAAGFSLEGTGLWRSYSGKDEDYVSGDIDDSLNMKIIERETYDEIREEYSDQDHEE